MPISQERILAIIGAGEDALQALNAVEAAVANEIESVSAGRLNAGEALGNLSSILRVNLLLSRPVATLVTISAERRHFNIRGRHNDRAKERMRRKRGGLAGSGSAPEDLLGGFGVTDEDAPF